MTGADPYVSGHGDLSFDVMHYDLSLTYAVPSNLLAGTAVLTCRAIGRITSVGLDLHATLKVSKVGVSGNRVQRFKSAGGKLTLKLEQPIESGTEFAVTVKYGGNPHPMRKPGLGDAGWEELDDGVIVAAQPHGAPSWFPCNDRPSSKATYTLDITLSADYHVEFSGEPVEVHRTGAKRIWSFRQPMPMAPYLATLQIGRYQVIRQPAAVPMRVVGPNDIRRNGFAASFGRQPEMMECFIEAFGPYPFSCYTTVITDDVLEIPLESQSLSTFGRNFASADWESVRLVAHEMAHQWFGNAVTVQQWHDIWLHEGFACYAEWLWSERSGDKTAAEWAAHHYQLLRGLRQDLLLADPTPEFMFDDRVYKRGALTLHALRTTVGDEQFFAILRSWVEANKGGSVTTEQFIEHCRMTTGLDLGSLFDAWLRERPLPNLF